ncbi:MAG: zinc-binding dehydrogenase [Chthonomonadetes bacterium]|nr:zinc-binding dehydrogenase [Chthonomonadetes bacterium]
MKTAVITGERQVEIQERPVPHAAGDFVVVRITVAPTCTEYKLYRDGYRTDMLGHEAAGEVVEVAQPGRVKVGDRVVVMPQYPCGTCGYCLSGDYIYCQNNINPLSATGNEAGIATYAQYVLKQDWLLIPLPEDISTEHGSMACCGLGPTFGAMQRMGVDAFDTVLITGAGPVGLGGVINGVFRGAKVIVAEPHPFRRQLAMELGAFAVIDPTEPTALQQVLDLTDGRGVDKGIECAGTPEAQRFLVDAVRRRGQIAFVAEAGQFTLHISNDLLRKGLVVHGIWHWNLADTPRMLQVIRSCGNLLDRMITHRFPLTRVQEAWELQMTGNCGKVILYPWEE